jgi:NAD(P)-dependent dehydrogenase (short-subunit alcohol dehydrogenase family)
MKIKGNSVLITGGSRGLGRALAHEFSRSGAWVGIVARNRVELESVARELRAEGGSAQAFVADLGRKEEIHPLVAQAAEALGGIDILINNASILGATPLPLLLDSQCEDFEATLAANLLGPFRLSKALMGAMILRQQGLILNLSSDAAVSAYPGWGMYGVSKAALDHLTRIWAQEIEGTGVKLISVDPGEMDTRMHADAVPDANREELADPAHVARKILAMIRESEGIPNGSRLVAPEWEPTVPFVSGGRIYL